MRMTIQKSAHPQKSKWTSKTHKLLWRIAAYSRIFQWDWLLLSKGFGRKVTLNSPKWRLNSGVSSNLEITRWFGGQKNILMSCFGLVHWFQYSFILLNFQNLLFTLVLFFFFLRMELIKYLAKYEIKITPTRSIK